MPLERAGHRIIHSLHSRKATKKNKQTDVKRDMKTKDAHILLKYDKSTEKRIKCD